MMKRAFIIISTLLILTSVKAQDSYIGINLGLSRPDTEFAGSENLFNDGYAVSGFTIEFDGIYFPGSIFGIGGMLGFGSYYTQIEPYFASVSDFIEFHPDNPAFSMPARNEVSFESGFWNYINLMAGPELAVPFWRFQLGVRAMGGTSIIITPKRTLSYSAALESLMVESRGTDLSLSYMYGASLMYFLSPGTSLRVTADYFSTKADYSFVANLDTPIGSISEDRNERIELNTLQLSIGLSYAF